MVGVGWAVRKYVWKKCKEDEENMTSRKEIEMTRQKTPMQKSQLARKDTGASEANANQVNIHIHSNRTSVLDQDESTDRTHDIEKSFRPLFDQGFKPPNNREAWYKEDSEEY
jgi:hypothetical protein